MLQNHALIIYLVQPSCQLAGFIKFLHQFRIMFKGFGLSESLNQKIDKGTKFGLENTSDYQKLYFDNLDLIAKWSKEILPKSNFIIADYGGGNGLVAKKIINELNKSNFSNYVVEIIDNDKSKFVKYKNLINLQEDILKYRKKERYDLSIIRYVMHLLDNKQRLQFLKNVYNNAKNGSYILIGNFVVDDENDYEIKRKILDYIEAKKDIKKRSIPKSEQIIDLIKQAGFKVEKKEKISYEITITDFYKNRFDLTNENINELIKIVGVERHQESQVFILARK